MILEKVMIGLTFAMPIGPVTSEAIKRGLTGGFYPAFKVKLGAAFGDTILIFILLLALSVIIKHTFICSLISIISSTVLIFFGFKSIRKSLHGKSNDNYSEVRGGTMGGFYFGLLIALTNPFALAWWLGSLPDMLKDSQATQISSLAFNFLGIIVPVLGGILLWDVFFCLLLEGGKRVLNDSMTWLICFLSSVGLVYFGFKFLSKSFITIFIMI